MKQGLNGAEHWRSLACQVLAGTPPWKDTPGAAEQLFATAVEKDPGNEAAWLGYLYYRSGCKVGTPDGERRYVDRLWQLVTRLNKHKEADSLVPLRMRATYALIAARWNLALLLDRDSGVSQEKSEERDRLRDEARQELNDLKKLVEGQRKSAEGTRQFAKEMNRAVQIFDDVASRMTAASKQPDSDTGGNISLSNYYLRACLRAENGEPGGFEEAVKDLDVALGLRTLREEVPSDPSLALLRIDRQRGPEVMAMLEKPRLSDIAFFKKHVDQLERDGIRYPDELLLRATGGAAKELAESLGVPKSTIDAMRQVCWLVECCPDPDQAVAWTDLLTREGIDTPQAIRQVFGNRKERERLRKRAWTVNASPLTDEVLLEWEYRLRLGLPVLT